MSGIYLTSQTAQPEISFVGVSRTICIIQCDPIQYDAMHIITGGTQNRNMIGQRYKVLSSHNQTPDWQDLGTHTHNLKIQISIESPLSGELSNQINQNSDILVKCLTLLSQLLVTSSAGLQEASETLTNIVEYYRDSMSDLQQTTLPQELKVTKGNIVSSVTRPPLVIDLD